MGKSDAPPSYDSSDSRPLPPGWISQFDQNHKRTFWVDTRANPPRSIWIHPLDDEQYQASQRSGGYSAPSGPPPGQGSYSGHQPYVQQGGFHQGPPQQYGPGPGGYGQPYQQQGPPMGYGGGYPQQGYGQHQGYGQQPMYQQQPQQSRFGGGGRGGGMGGMGMPLALGGGLLGGMMLGNALSDSQHDAYQEGYDDGGGGDFGDGGGGE